MTVLRGAQPPRANTPLQRLVGFRDAAHGGEDGRHLLGIIPRDGIGIATADSEVSTGTDDLTTRSQVIADAGASRLTFSSTVNTRVPGAMSVSAE